MAETLTVTVDDGGTYTVDVKGVSLFTDQALTMSASFPTTVSAQTTWYAAVPAKPGRRDRIEVKVTAPSGATIPVDTFTSLPATVDLVEGQVSFGAAPSSGASVPVRVTPQSDRKAA